MNDPGLKMQVIFVVNFHKLVWNKHFQWLQEECPKSKLAGFRSVDMPVRCYLMRRDLLELQATWSTMSDYKSYFDIVDALPNESEEQKEIRLVLKERFPAKFFQIALNTFDSNFDQWRTSNLKLVLTWRR
jgi:hypothetical protein